MVSTTVRTNSFKLLAAGGGTPHAQLVCSREDSTRSLHSLLMTVSTESCGEIPSLSTSITKLGCAAAELRRGSRRRDRPCRRDPNHGPPTDEIGVWCST